MDTNNKYYNLIERLVKSNRKFPGCESIVEEIIDDVYSHAEIIINSIQNESVIEKYLDKIVLTSIITISKKHNIKRATASPTVATALNDETPKELPPQSIKSSEDNDFGSGINIGEPKITSPHVFDLTSSTEEVKEAVVTNNNTEEKIEIERANSVYVDNMINSIASDSISEQEDTTDTEILEAEKEEILLPEEEVSVENEVATDSAQPDGEDDFALSESDSEPIADEISEFDIGEVSNEGSLLDTDGSSEINDSFEETETEITEDVVELQDSDTVISEEEKDAYVDTDETTMDSFDLTDGVQETFESEVNGTLMDEVEFTDAEDSETVTTEYEPVISADMDAVDLGDAVPEQSSDLQDDNSDMMESFSFDEDVSDISEQNEDVVVSIPEETEDVEYNSNTLDDSDDVLSELAEEDDSLETEADNDKEEDIVSEGTEQSDTEEMVSDSSEDDEFGAELSEETGNEELFEVQTDELTEDETIQEEQEFSGDVFNENEDFDIHPQVSEDDMLETDSDELELGFPAENDEMLMEDGDIELSETEDDFSIGHANSSSDEIPYEPSDDSALIENTSEPAFRHSTEEVIGLVSDDIPVAAETVPHETEEHFKPLNYSVFAYETKEKFDNDIEQSGLSEKILDLHKEHAELNILNIFELKYKKNMSLDDISKELGMEKADVLSALNLLVDVF